MVVVEEGQITRAAQRLHLAQPALSQSIAKLESQLGVRLLDRRPRGIEPTPAGAAFYAKARLALTAVEEAQDALLPWARSEDRLSLGFLPMLGLIARPWLRRFICAHPEVDLETRHLTPQERLTELKRGRIDTELLFPPPNDPDVSSIVILQLSALRADARGALAGREPSRWSTNRSPKRRCRRVTRACPRTGPRRRG